MNNKVREAFGQIHAADQLKDDTYSFLQKEMEKRSVRRHKSALRPLVSFCALLFLFAGLGGWYVWEAPVSYVSIDVNPSVELTLNRFNWVTDADSRNDAGKIILEGLRLEGKKYIDAVDLLVASDSMQSYLTEDAVLTFTVASPRAEEILDGLKSSAAATQHHGTCRQASMETAHSAHQCGMSVGKYQSYLNLSEYDKTVTPEDCRDMSMRQLHDQISHYRDTSPKTSGGHSESHSDEHSDSHSDEYWDGQTTDPSDERSVDQTYGQSDNSTNEKSDGHSSGHKKHHNGRGRN